MSLLETALLQKMAEAVGWALLHLLWQGALIAAGLYLALSLLRKATSSVRYAASCTALLLMLILPAGTAWVAFQRSSPAPVEVSTPSGKPPAPAASEARAEVIPAASKTAIESARAFVRRNLPVVVAVWLLGVVLLSSRLLFDWARLRRMVHDAAPAHEWLVSIERLRLRLGVVPRVWILLSESVDVPTVIGWFRPVILMPLSAVSGLTPEQIESVIAHELAHIRRHDFLVNMVQTAVETLLFYHPATWWISKQIRIERENCCDDLAVEACGDPLLYARALATLEGLRGPLQPTVAANGGSLLARVRRLLGRSTDPASRWTSGVVLLVLVSAVFIAAPITVLALKPRLTGLPATANLTVMGTRLSDSEAIEEAVAEALADEQEALAEAVAEAEAEAREALENDEEAEHDFDDLLIDGQLPIEAIIALRTHDVSAAYIDALQAAGLGKLTVGDVTAMAMQGVSTEYIESMRGKMFRSVDVEDIVAMATHGVDVETIEELRKLGLTIEVPEEAVSMAIHGVTPEFVRSVREAGINAAGDELMAMRIHGISPEEIAEWEKLGFRPIDLDTIMSFAIHGLDPEEVSELRSLGLDNLSAADLQAFAVHGIDADYVRHLRDAGYTDLTAEELIKLAIAGVDADYIIEMRK
jgi:beta-lactamase regulating signal transducer with metallopeptidase domain